MHTYSKGEVGMQTDLVFFFELEPSHLSEHVLTAETAAPPWVQMVAAVGRGEVSGEGRGVKGEGRGESEGLR